MANQLSSHLGGRPTKYTPELQNKIGEFFDEAVPTNMRIPTVEGLCLKLGIFKDTAYRWAKEYPEFSDALQLIKDRQKEYLTEIGIFGGKEINANIVALFLKANHGMVETQRTEVTGTDGKAVQLNLTAYGGFIPPNRPTAPSPEGSDVLSGTVQSPGLASQSEKDNNGTDGDDKTGPS